MTESVAAFIEWWQSLTPAQRREEIARARERKSFWLEQRAHVLFGLLEEDSVFGVLNQCTVALSPLATPDGPVCVCRTPEHGLLRMNEFWKCQNCGKPIA